MPDLNSLATLTDQASALPNPAQGTTPLKTTGSIGDSLSAEDTAALSHLATEILKNPLALQHLCDRVYTLMQQDLHRQRERTRIHS